MTSQQIVTSEVSLGHSTGQVNMPCNSLPVCDRNGDEFRGIHSSRSKKVLPKSPISVVHLLSLDSSSPLKMTSMDAPTKPTSLDDDCSQTSHSTLPPPLEQVTVCSSTAGDYDDDLSCLSSEDEQPSPKRPPRSIFQQFWHKSGALPTPIRRQVQEPIASDVLGSDGKLSHTSDIYERAIQVHEQAPRLRRSERRRSIFKLDPGLCKSSRSTPELSVNSLRNQVGPIRKTQSSSTFHSRSILRTSCRYSYTGDAATATPSNCTSSDRSVSFSPNVKVAVFEEPAERYAEEGWSSWFH